MDCWLIVHRCLARSEVRFPRVLPGYNFQAIYRSPVSSDPADKQVGGPGAYPRTIVRQRRVTGHLSHL